VAYSTVSKKSGATYYLHSKSVTLRGGHVQRIYYFARTAGSNVSDSIPSGYKIIEDGRTGLPFLKKS